MNISRTIREQRNKLSLSQDELGEKVYVTRQTISNWENDKSYPDVHSLILLSQVFDMTIDNLVKGDLEIMEKTIETHDVMAMSRYNKLMHISIGVAFILLPLSWYLGSVLGMLASTCVIAAAIYFECQVEKIKKQYDVQTYREIVAFSKGETLDEIAKIRESGKRKYQRFLRIAAYALVGAISSQVVWWILRALRG